MTRAASAAIPVLALLVTACAGDLPRSRASRRCTATKQIVDDYVDRLAARASNYARSDVLTRHEVAYVSFALAADGSASEFQVVSAKRPEAGQEVLRAAAAASPYPRPPFDPKACLIGGRATISLVGHGRCNDTLASEYTGGVAARIQDAVYAAEITAMEPERIALRIRVDREGAASAIEVHDAKTTEAGERVAALARTLAPFGVPGNAIEECVADLPFFVWVNVPGLTRPPIRIPDS